MQVDARTWNHEAVTGGSKGPSQRGDAPSKFRKAGEKILEILTVGFRGVGPQKKISKWKFRRSISGLSPILALDQNAARREKGSKLSNLRMRTNGTQGRPFGAQNDMDIVLPAFPGTFLVHGGRAARRPKTNREGHQVGPGNRRFVLSRGSQEHVRDPKFDPTGTHHFGMDGEDFPGKRRPKFSGTFQDNILFCAFPILEFMGVSGFPWDTESCVFPVPDRVAETLQESGMGSRPGVAVNLPFVRRSNHVPKISPLSVWAFGPRAALPPWASNTPERPGV